MSGQPISRRAWLALSPLTAAVLAAQQHAHEAMRSAEPPALTVLNAKEAAELGAITSQIIPTDATPGAREAGVIYFIDRALATFDSDKRAVYTRGLAETERKCTEMFQAASIADLRPEQQIELLQA